VDLNEASPDAGDARPGGVTILLSLNRRIQVVKIGDDARVVRVSNATSGILNSYLTWR